MISQTHCRFKRKRHRAYSDGPRFYHHTTDPAPEENPIGDTFQFEYQTFHVPMQRASFGRYKSKVGEMGFQTVSTDFAHPWNRHRPAPSVWCEPMSFYGPIISPLSSWGIVMRYVVIRLALYQMDLHVFGGILTKMVIVYIRIYTANGGY